jgi:hypothetical protein
MKHGIWSYLTVGLLVPMLMLVAVGCNGGNGGGGEEKLSWKFTFEQGKEGWTGDFVDLPVDYDPDLYELEFGHADWPKDLGKDGKALMISSHNRSDDVFMYVKKKLTAADGVEPNAVYLARFNVEFATNAPKGAVGIGGPPGEAVFFKVGAAAEEPVPVVVDADSDYPYYGLNVDRGSQNDEGRNALLIGNVAKEQGSDDDYTYALKTLGNKDRPLRVTADGEGNLWVFVGTDSGFEGKTTLYYTSIEITLEKVE